MAFPLGNQEWRKRKGDSAGRFWAKVAKQSDCWTWKGAKDRGGYGQLKRDGRHHLSHRFAYELLVGPIPDGLTLDHLCRNRACVNPAHLEIVSQRTNILRGIGPTADNARKDHCPKGHSYNEQTTYISSKGWRYCKVCQRIAQREYWQRHPEQRRIAQKRRNAEQKRIYQHSYRQKYNQEHRAENAEYLRKWRKARREAMEKGRTD